MGITPYGVGLVAAGPVSQAIHLPTLARMSDRFRVVHVADVGRAVAEEVADRADARHSYDAADLIADAAVDVVMIGSPDRFHADQVIAACEAGKVAVVCEKPLALTIEDAQKIAECSARTGVPVIVGTMHAFDTAWVSASRAWEHGGLVPHTVRVSAVLPPNPWSEDFATEVTGRPTTPPPHSTAAEQVVAMVRGGVLGLAIHDLPLARRLLPSGALRVLIARPLAPWGVEIVATVGDSVLELHGTVGVGWEPRWTLEAIAEDSVLEASFPLSYVHSGSSTISIGDGDRSTVFGPYPDDGYLNEWEYVYDVITHDVAAPRMTDLIADLRFAVELATQAEALVRKTAAR